MFLSFQSFQSYSTRSFNLIATNPFEFLANGSWGHKFAKVSKTSRRPNKSRGLTLPPGPQTTKGNQISLLQNSSSYRLIPLHNGCHYFTFQTTLGKLSQYILLKQLRKLRGESTSNIEQSEEFWINHTL